MTDTYHSLCLKDIRMQSNMSKQIQKNLKILLHYLPGSAGDTTIICIEFANGISANLAMPLTENAIDDDVEEQGRQDVSLPNTTFRTDG